MLAALGPGATGETLAYAAIPEWLTGMGVAVVEPAVTEVAEIEENA
jgi:2,3-dihydroxyphenylpropionate 1,2-dioxygenase